MSAFPAKATATRSGGGTGGGWLWPGEIASTATMPPRTDVLNFKVLGDVFMMTYRLGLPKSNLGDWHTSA
jgi:hypothetical protein